MLEQMSQATGILSRMFATLGALGSALSFLLAIYLEWDNIKARVKGETHRVKGQAAMRGYHFPQTRAKSKPTLRVPMGGHPASKSPRLDIAQLIGNLFLSLVKTMFAIFMAVVVSAEYLLFADNYLRTGLPYEWLLIASLALGPILGAYSRVRSWFFLLLMSILSQIGILYLNGWNLQDVLVSLEGFAMSGLVAGL
jgi:hypothetical protein